MLRLAFDFIITWRETRTRPNAYGYLGKYVTKLELNRPLITFISLVLYGSMAVCYQIYHIFPVIRSLYLKGDCRSAFGILS